MPKAPVAELVDAADLKSVSSNRVPVRFRPGAPLRKWYMRKRFNSAWEPELALFLNFGERLAPISSLDS